MIAQPQRHHATVGPSLRAITPLLSWQFWHDLAPLGASFLRPRSRDQHHSPHIPVSRGLMPNLCKWSTSKRRGWPQNKPHAKRSVQAEQQHSLWSSALDSDCRRRCNYRARQRPSVFQSCGYHTRIFSFDTLRWPILVLVIPGAKKWTTEMLDANMSTTPYHERGS